MKHLFTIFVAILLCFATTCCTVLSQFNAIDTGTAVSSGNFHYVKSVQGVGKSIHVLGFGGYRHSAKAIEDAKAQADLKDNQALVNVVVTSTTGLGLFGLISRVETTVTADVIEFE